VLENTIVDSSPRPASTVESAWNFFQPYADFEADFVYNALFCDSICLFRHDLPTAQTAPWSIVLAEPPPIPALQSLVDDDSAPSRLRALACDRLRAAGHEVVSRAVLAVIVEFPLSRSQETLAACADGSVRYIRHNGATSLFDSGVSNVAARARKLVAAAQRLLCRFDGRESRRLAPPQGDRIRITLVSCGGLHVSEGHLHTLQKDALTGPVLGNAIWLLQAHTLLVAG